MAHEDLDYEGMEQDRAAPEAGDYGAVHESEPEEDLDYEGAEQGGVTVEGAEDEGVEQDVTQEGVGQEGVELGDRPEEVPATGSEDRQERGAEGSRDAVEDEVEEVEDSTDTVGQQSTTVTNAPVSLLSQKHLFWFPSETFNEEEEAPKQVDEPAAADTDGVPAEGDNHIGLKPTESDAGVVAVHQEHDQFDVSPPTREPQNETREGAGETATSSDESWLDGYPITQEVEKDGEEGEKVGSTGAGEEEDEDEEEEEAVPVTDSPNHVEIREPDTPSPVPSEDVTQIVASPTRPADYDIEHVPVALTPTSPPENISGGTEDVEPELTTAPSAVEPAEATTTTTSTSDDNPVTPDFAILDHDAAVGPTAPWETTESLDPFLDLLPAPTDQDEVTAPDQDLQERPTGSPDEFAGTSLHDVRVETNLTQEGAGANFQPTEEPCAGNTCPSGVGRGPVIAIVIVAICALITATALAVWCYKKRQEKSSVYKMNGKGQSRQPQQIEMQQKV